MDQTVCLNESESTIERLKRRAARGGVIVLSTRFGLQVFSWLVTLVVARILRPHDYGVLTSGVVFINFACLIAEAGLGKALVQKSNVSAGEVNQAFTLSLCLSACMYAVLFGLADVCGRVFSVSQVPAFIRVVGLILFAVPIKAIAGSLLERRLDLGKQSVSIALASITQSTVVVVLAICGAGYWALAAGVLVSVVLENVVLCFQARWVPAFEWPTRECRDAFRFGMNFVASSILWYVYSNADVLVLSHLAGPDVLGQYAFAFSLISIPVVKLTANLNQVAYPVYCRLQDDPERLGAWYLRTVTMLGVVSFPAMMGLALVASDAIPLVLGEKWAPAILPFRMLSLVGALMVIGSSLAPVFNALGHPEINVRYSGVCCLLLPPSFYVACRLSGVKGVCLAWLVLYPLLQSVLVCCTRRITGIGLPDILRALSVPALAVLIMSVTVILTQRAVVAQPGAVRLVVSIAVGCVSYMVAICVLAGGSAGRDIRSLLQRALSKG